MVSRIGHLVMHPVISRNSRNPVSFLPTAFDQLFWIICIYCSASYCQSQNARYLIWFCIFGHWDFLTKYSIVFSVRRDAYFVVNLSERYFSEKEFMDRIANIPCVNHTEPLLANKKSVSGDHSFFPIIRQSAKPTFNGRGIKEAFSFFKSLHNDILASRTVRDSVYFKFKRYKLISFALCCSFVFLFCAKGKWYYFFPVVIGAIPLGTVFFERLLQKRKWIIYAYLTVLRLTGVYLLPQGIPIIKLQRFIELYHKKPNKDGKIPLAFDNYYSTEIWTRILNVVNKTYIELPSEEQEKCFILGRHYSMAGAMNLLGKKYGLPQAFSLHSSFEWMPEFDKGAVIIAIGESNWLEQHWGEYFKYVKEIGIVENKYASKESEYNYRIFLCKGLKYNSVEFKRFIEN